MTAEEGSWFGEINLQVLNKDRFSFDEDQARKTNGFPSRNKLWLLNQLLCLFLCLVSNSSIFTSLNFCGGLLDWFFGRRIPMWYLGEKVSIFTTTNFDAKSSITNPYFWDNLNRMETTSSKLLTLANLRLSMMLDCILMAAGFPVWLFGWKYFHWK